MRIRVPGRFIAAWAILSAFLYLVPASTQVAVARPVGWNDVGPGDPGDSGDNDGVVLKNRGSGGGGTGAAIAPTTTLSQTVSARPSGTKSSLRMFLLVLRSNYWFLWLR